MCLGWGEKYNVHCRMFSSTPGLLASTYQVSVVTTSNLPQLVTIRYCQMPFGQGETGLAPVKNISTLKYLFIIFNDKKRRMGKGIRLYSKLQGPVKFSKIWRSIFLIIILLKHILKVCFKSNSFIHNAVNTINL